MDVFVTRHGETAWKMFDDYLQEFAMRSGEPFHPFDIDTNYRLYIDGKPRFDGARDFLNSRGLQLPEALRGPRTIHHKSKQYAALGIAKPICSTRS
jgi:hypothetical protein